jgi:hypothetical protein
VSAFHDELADELGERGEDAVSVRTLSVSVADGNGDGLGLLA